MSEITGLFALAAAGDAQAFDRIFTLLYPDLESMARSRLRRGERVTMADTGALVHESWMRLQRAGTLRFEDRAHFMAHAARVMRSVITDIARHLQGRPIAAQADAPMVRLRKYIARHRLQAGALGAVLLSLTVGLGAALWQAGVARQERNAAREEAERGSAINFFFSDLLEEAARSEKPVSGSALVARAEELARREFKDRPDALAAMLLSLGMLHNGQGRQPEARRVLEEAYAVVRDPAFRNDVACDLALLLEDKQRALKMLNTVADQPGTSARSRAACLVYLGDLLRAGDAELAEKRYRQALREWEATASRSPHDQATILGRLAYVAALQGRTTEALRGYEQALAISATVGRDASTMGTALRHRMGRTLLIAGAPEQALAVFDDLLAQRRRAQDGGAMPSDVLVSRTQALLDLGRIAEAQAAAQAALDAATATGHAVRQAQAACQLQWAQALQPGAAVAPAPGASSADALVQVTCALAQSQQLRAQGRLAELQAQTAGLLAQKPPEPQWAVDARLLRAEALMQTGHPETAETEARAALAEARRLQDGSADTLRARAAQQLLNGARHGAPR